MRSVSRAASSGAHGLVLPNAAAGSRFITSRSLSAALLLAASPSTIALAQTAEPTQLDPLVVEAQKKKKSASKKSSKPKKAAAAAPVQPAPQPAPAVTPSAQDGAVTPGGNPYANPNAPYQVQQSASGKLTEPLLNTPRTVTAVPKEVLDDKEVRTLRDLARETPGLTIGAAEGGASFGNLFLRGFNSRGDIFVDNLRDPGNVTREFFAVEQVEIYKGPSGGIAGRGTIGGAINLISKQPHFTHDFYEVETTVGTDSTVRTTLDVNEKVTNDFAVRANLMYNQNEVAGRDFTEGERWGGMISASAKPAEWLQVTLDYYRLRNDVLPDWGVPINNATKMPWTESGLPRDTFYGQLNLDFFKEEADVGTATVVAKLADNVTLTNRTRVGSNSLDYYATAPQPNNVANAINPSGYQVGHPQRDQSVDLVANQTELAYKFWTGPLKHNLVAGLEVSREEFTRYAYSTGPSVGQGQPNPASWVSLFNPDPYRTSQFISAKTWTYDAQVDTVATYLNDTVHLSEQWIINGGIRYDDFQRDQVGSAANTVKVEAGLWSWNAGIVYKPVPIASIYAAYATAQSPIGNDLDATGAQYNGLSTALVDAPPQEARAFEAGTKWELFDRRLLATAAYFHTHVDNARTNTGVTNPTNVAAAFSGEYEVQGIELSVAGNVTDKLSVFGGFVYLDSEVLASDVVRDIGEPLANVPAKQFSLLAKYQLTDDLAVGGQAIYSDKIWAGHLARNATMRHTVDWWRFDAFAEYQFNDNWAVEVAGLNLTDELYYDAMYQGGGYSFVAPGRAGYLTVKWKSN